MTRYVVSIARSDVSRFYVAAVPDLPGCRSQGDSFDDALQNVREAIEVHLLGLHEAGEAIPIPATDGLITVDAALRHNARDRALSHEHMVAPNGQHVTLPLGMPDLDRDMLREEVERSGINWHEFERAYFEHDA